VAVFLFSAVSLAFLLSPALFDVRRSRMEQAFRELEQHRRPFAD
jgi:hypothetical protein